MTVAGRRAAVLVLTAAAVGATLACSPGAKSPPAGGSPTSSSAATLDGGPTPGATPIDYPHSAADYATADVTAWSTGDTTRVAQLTDDAATIFSTLSAGNYNKAFHLYQCTGAAGSSICAFYNEVGDELDLRLLNTKIGGPDAVVEGQWHPITFPDDLRAYAEEALNDWNVHNSAAVSLLTGKPGDTAFAAVPDARRGDAWTYSHQEGAAGHLLYLFTNTAGDTVVIQFANPTIVAPPPNRHGLIETVYYTAHT